MNKINQLLRNLPAVDRVLNEESLKVLSGQLPQEAIAAAVQDVIGELRNRIVSDNHLSDPERIKPDQVANAAALRCQTLLHASLRKVINASGTLLHTNLGRAPLAAEALAAIEAVATGYSNLEYDLVRGQRGYRHDHVEQLLTQLTGAEAALVVNNNAGAVLLALSALGSGREAIVSRGELVEIGGAFRIPDVMQAGGLTLREVGSSNRTHLHDYQQAVNENTAILLKVHTSNYRIVGFTKEVGTAELKPVAQEHGLVLMEDLGSGLLLDLSRYGLEREPTVPEVVASGVDVVTFSGDKLLGGPQAGIIVGKRTLIDRIARHPLTRALRIDKLTLAALEATLRLYLQPQMALESIPVLRMFSSSADLQRERCQALCDQLIAAALPADLRLVEDRSRVGGGAMPLTELSDWAVEIDPHNGQVAGLTEQLRTGTPAVVARVQNDRLLINLRAIFVDEEPLLLQTLVKVLGA